MTDKKLKIFFGCSMRGGYSTLELKEVAKIPELIESLGYELASKHQTERDVITKEDNLEPNEIHDRDYEWLKESDIGIFEISNPSLGVGGEISDMVHLGKPVLCVYKYGLRKKISAYIRGKKGSEYIKTPFACKSYLNIEEAGEKIKQFVEENS